MSTPTTRKFLGLLATTIVVLVGVHLVLNWYSYHVDELPWLLVQLFELDEENNLPTWFSSFLLLSNAAVLFVAAQESSEHRFHWRLLSAGFLLLSIDEVAGLHETFHTSIDSNWTIYAAVLVAIVGLSFVPFLLSLPRKLAVGFIVSGGLYLGGALLVEWLSRDMDEDTFGYAMAVALEEGLEMTGAWLFLMLNVNRLKGEITVKF